jgi:hypothetical protein
MFINQTHCTLVAIIIMTTTAAVGCGGMAFEDELAQSENALASYQRVVDVVDCSIQQKADSEHLACRLASYECEFNFLDANPDYPHVDEGCLSSYRVQWAFLNPERCDCRDLGDGTWDCTLQNRFVRMCKEDFYYNTDAQSAVSPSVQLSNNDH